MRTRTRTSGATKTTTRTSTSLKRPAVSDDAKAEARLRCTRFLSLHRPKTAREWLEQLTHAPAAEHALDLYGKRGALAALEARVATLLGKDAGVFVMKGTIAQMAALRVWTERSGIATVALHPRSHIDFDEQRAYELLHRLIPLRLGSHSPFRVEDLQAVRERIGVVVVELPLRRAGYRLPSWDELVAISDWCRAHDLPLHFDGARLWESAPFYARPLAEIAALADSVYVSFYKGLGALAGCVLCGTSDFIEDVRLWQTRHGGNLFTAFPYVIAAEEGLNRHLPQMERYHLRARELASELARLPGVRIAPDPPHTNAFQVYLPGNEVQLEQAALEIAEAERVWLFNAVSDSPLPDLSMAEIAVGEATDDLADDEIAGLLRSLVERARAD